MKKLPKVDDEKTNIVLGAIERQFASKSELDKRAEKLTKVERNVPDLKKLKNGEMRAVFDGTNRKIYIKIGGEVWSLTATKEM